MNAWGRRIVGVLQIAGGATGVVMALVAIGSATAGKSLLYEEMTLCAVSALSVIAGVLVLENHSRGVSLSKIVQLASLPVVYTPFLSYQLFMGLTIRATIVPVRGVQTFWANGLRIQLFSGSQVYVGLDLLALALFVYLRRCSRSEPVSAEMLIAETFD